METILADRRCSLHDADLSFACRLGRYTARIIIIGMITTAQAAPDFTGRDHHVTRLLGTLSRDRTSRTMVLCTVTGLLRFEFVAVPGEEGATLFKIQQAAVLNVPPMGSGQPTRNHGHRRVMHGSPARDHDHLLPIPL